MVTLGELTKFFFSFYVRILVLKNGKIVTANFKYPDELTIHSVNNMPFCNSIRLSRGFASN